MSFISELAAKRRIFLEGLDANEGDINLGIFEDFYPDEAHFIYELLQNAEDAGATEVSFELNPHGCAFVHNGSRHFDEDDIKAITGIFNSSKKNNPDKIGKFGVGFKSVFVYTETPVVYSKDFSFRISQLVLPEEVSAKDSLGECTRFEFPFNNPKMNVKQAYAEIKAGLEDISETTLLFLNNLKSIRWEIDKQKGAVVRKEHSEYHLEVLKMADKTSVNSSHWLRFKKPVEGIEKQNVAIAFELALMGNEKVFDPQQPLSNQAKIVPAKRGYVSVFFPAKKETSGLRFHLHAPFVPELSRASIKESSVNIPLYAQLSALTAASLHRIRDLGLLSADLLAVLPNPHDPIPKRYQAIREAIVNEMNEQPLTPTYSKLHKPAKSLLQSSASLKGILSSDDLEVLSTASHYFRSQHFAVLQNRNDWAVGATQSNSNQDKFLSGLDIKKWDFDGFNLLLEKAMRDWNCGQNDDIESWMATKSESWHQNLYATLYNMRYNMLDVPKIQQMAEYFRIRCSDGEYWLSDNCYFPSENGEDAPGFFYVAKNTFTSGSNKAEQANAKKFLEILNVTKVGEAELVTAILDQRYRKKNLKPDRNDLNRFIALVELEPSTASLFADYFIFQIPDGKWHMPRFIFIDTPFRPTGLSMWYAASGENASHYALNDNYLNCGIEKERLVKFAEAVGAQMKLEVKRVSCQHNPDWRKLYFSAPSRQTDYGHDEDYDLDGIANVLKCPSLEVSKLIWQTLMQGSQNWTAARYRPNSKQLYQQSPSQLAHHLKNSEWVPQEGGIFVRPSDASIEKLPEGFPIDKGWGWLRAIGFGENDEAIEQERFRQVEENKKKRELAKSVGFEDEDSLQVAQKALQLFGYEELKRIIDEQEKKKEIDLPTHTPKNPQLRTERVVIQALDAPERISEQRMRNVSVGKTAVTTEAKQYLQHQYTNADGVMFCQICWGELPFKLPDHSYYFEAVEFLSDLKKLHKQNHLALCPNHAAMFKHANGSADSLLNSVRDLDGTELAIELAGFDERIYFSADHVVDLKAVIGADTAAPAGKVIEPV